MVITVKLDSRDNTPALSWEPAHRGNPGYWYIYVDIELPGMHQAYWTGKEWSLYLYDAIKREYHCDIEPIYEALMAESRCHS